MSAKLLKLNMLGLSLLLCFTILAGCSSQQPADNDSLNPPTSESDISQPQEMTMDELHQYFKQVFDTKGNALDTPEQLALELSELRSLTTAAALPEDYEAQYKAWRVEQVGILLKNLQSEYEQIIAGASLYDGIHAGVAYADYVDFEGDGVKELFLLSLSPEIDGSEIKWSCSIEIYNGVSGHAEAYNNETVICPYLRRSDYDAKSISLVQCQNRTYIHTNDTEGRNIEDTYYGIGNHSIIIVDNTFASEGTWSSSNQEISLDEYEAIHAKYTDVISLATNNSVIPVQNRGILPELSSEAQKRLAFLETLETCHPQYARLADMDGDGVEDLIVVVDGEHLPFFRILLWNGSELQTINLDQEMDYIDGIYQEKTTGKIYVCYSGGVGPYSWYFYERVSEVIKISEEELSWEECQAKRDSFELVENLMWELPRYDTVETVRQQLITK